MSLNQQDRDLIRAEAREIAYDVSKEFLAEHLRNCPVTHKLGKWKAWGLGLLFGVAIASGGGVLAAFKILSILGG